MRTRDAGLAALLLLAMVAMVIAGGRLVQPDSPEMTVEPIAAEDLPPMDDTEIDDIGDTDAEPEAPPTSDEQAWPSAPMAEPEADTSATNAEKPLERIAPRPPLSELSLAVPPKPKAPKDLTGEPLFRPVAEAAGVIAVKGQSLTVAGIEVVEPQQSCTDDAGKSWPCGARARTAFRSFLRGRAVTCATADEPGDPQCSIGKQDIGEWLVENGWARAVPGGPYEEAGEKAKAARKGIFAAAPNLSGLPPVPAMAETSPAETTPAGQSSILDLSGEPPATQAPAMPPTGQPAPFQ